MSVYLRAAFNEPYRLFFPLGILYLLCGILIWLPQMWNPGDYPVALHRYLVLNGFSASFIGGFLMTAVPKFSKTLPARSGEVLAFFFVTLLGIICAHLNLEKWTFAVSVLQVSVLLFFLFFRVFKRKENPPYSFVFIFVGLLLWLLSALACVYFDNEAFKRLHYEGAIAAIILGVGSRLIPGIFGHVEIVTAQRAMYENPKPIFATVPMPFFVLILAFVSSYFLSYPFAEIIRALVLGIISMYFWCLYKLPKIKSSLTFCIWISSWMIMLSFLLRAIWEEGGIHAGHAFFINGIVLLSLLIATRVLQSHGPQDKNLENWKGLYWVSGIIILASLTRVSAYLLPESYLKHLGYSSLLLTLAVVVWSYKYLRLIMVYPKR